MPRKKYILRIQTKSGTFRTLIWWHADDKAYLVRVPSLPGTVTFGTSLADAKRMAKDAIELYCSVMLDEGKIIVGDTGRAIGRLPKSRIFVPAARKGFSTVPQRGRLIADVAQWQSNPALSLPE